MRVWDVHPGYLSRPHLLGEHREIHAVWTVITQSKKGYANHPETMRWRGNLDELSRRHELVVREMALRGYQHHSPLLGEDERYSPFGYVDSIEKQFHILKGKYEDGKSGRIPLPKNIYEFWAHHKYSVMARGYQLYSEISRRSTTVGHSEVWNEKSFVIDVYNILRESPDLPSLKNALEHVTGYFKEITDSQIRRDWIHRFTMNPQEIQLLIYEYALENGLTYIAHSTILSDVL